MTPRLAEKIACHIKKSGGAIGFDQWMAMALYDPDGGYYEGADPFAAEGDFITAADLGPWAALAFADLIDWSWGQFGQPKRWALVEQGGGNGTLLAAVVQLLQSRDLPLPEFYAVERSATLRARQRRRYQCLDLPVHICSDLNHLPPLEHAVHMSNELPDAFPVRCFVAEQGALYERLVGWDGTRFTWKQGTQPLTPPLVISEDVRASWPEEYRSEWNPHLHPWMQTCANIAKQTILLCVDYGFPQAEYYRPERCEGTLMGHARHRVVTDILLTPGSCDITAHIDFTALLDATRTAGFTAITYMPQWAWLAQSPSVQQHIGALADKRDVASMQEVAQAKRLMMPQGMGETFKLFVAGRGIETPRRPDHLTDFDQLARLEPESGELHP